MDRIRQCQLKQAVTDSILSMNTNIFFKIGRFFGFGATAGLADDFRTSVIARELQFLAFPSMWQKLFRSVYSDGLPSDTSIWWCCSRNFSSSKSWNCLDSLAPLRALRVGCFARSGSRTGISLFVEIDFLVRDKNRWRRWQMRRWPDGGDWRNWRVSNPTWGWDNLTGIFPTRMYCVRWYWWFRGNR